MALAEHPNDPTREFRFSNFDFFRLAAPNTLSAISIPLAGLVNTMVVGQVGDASMIAGVAVSSALLNIIFFAFNFMRSGTLGLTAQAHGAGDVREEKGIALRSAVLAAVIGTLLVCLQVPIAHLGLQAFNAQAGVLDAARTYYSLRIWTAPFTLLNFAVIGWVMGRGQAVLALVLQVVGNGFNIASSLLFVIIFGLGIDGAALAAVVSEMVTALLGAIIVIATIAQVPSPQIFDREKFLRMAKVNGDIFVRSLFLFLALALFTRLGTEFGPAVLAANALLLGIFQTSAAGLDGISAAAEQLVGYAVGSRSVPAFGRAVRISLVWGAVTSIVLATLLSLGIGPLVSMSTKSPDVLAAALNHGFWVPIAILSSAVAYQMDGVFVGATWSKSMRDIMVISASMFAVLAYLLSGYFGNDGLWAAFVIFLSLRGGLSFLHLKRNNLGVAKGFRGPFDRPEKP